MYQYYIIIGIILLLVLYIIGITNAALLYFIIESVKLVEKPDSKKSLLDKLYNKKF